MKYRYVYRYGEEGNPVPKYRKKYMEIGGVRYMLTRYTHEISRTTRWPDGSRVLGPRGGNAVREYARYVWYSNGRFYRIIRRNVCEDTFKNEMVPLSGRIWDCHRSQTYSQGIPEAEIECDEGYPTKVTLDRESYPMNEGMWPMCEELLYLDGRKLPRSSKRMMALV